MDEDFRPPQGWRQVGNLKPPRPAQPLSRPVEEIIAETKEYLEAIRKERAEMERRKRGAAPESAWRNAKLTPERLAELLALMDKRQ